MVQLSLMCNFFENELIYFISDLNQIAVKIATLAAFSDFIPKVSMLFFSESKARRIYNIWPEWHQKLILNYLTYNIIIPWVWSGLQLFPNRNWFMILNNLRTQLFTTVTFSQKRYMSEALCWGQSFQLTCWTITVALQLIFLFICELKAKILNGLERIQDQRRSLCGWSPLHVFLSQDSAQN